MKPKKKRAAKKNVTRCSKPKSGASRVTRPRKNGKRSRVTHRAKKAAGASRVTRKTTAAPSRNSSSSHTRRQLPSRKAARNSSGRRSQKRRGRNPELAAERELYEIFHGRAPENTVEHEELLEIRAKFAELGKLNELRFLLDGERSPMPLTGFGACQVAATADGTNIYFLGGDQRVPLDALAIESDKDYVELGPCTYIRYFTRKGFHDFEPVEYYHEFGEEDGIRPVLAYDSLNEKLFLIGGNYRVRAEGIVN